MYNEFDWMFDVVHSPPYFFTKHEPGMGVLTFGPRWDFTDY